MDLKSIVSKNKVKNEKILLARRTLHLAHNLKGTLNLPNQYCSRASIIHIADDSYTTGKRSTKTQYLVTMKYNTNTDIRN